MRSITESGVERFHLIDLDRYRRNLSEFLAAMRAHYADVVLAYSYKTNYLRPVAQTADLEGCLAEVVSEVEYDMALAYGVQPERIVLNGPVKSRELLLRALAAGTRVNADSLAEIEVLLDLVKELERDKLHVGVRLNFSLNGSPRSHFGVDPTAHGVADRIRQLAQLVGCDRFGVHVHFSTSHRSVASFRERTEQIIAWTHELLPDMRPATLDIGGGFFGPMSESMRRSFGTDVPNYVQYAEAVAGTMAKAYPDGGPSLIFEPGASVVANVMYFCCKVLHVKDIDGRQIIQLNGSIQNIQPTGRSRFRLPFERIAMSAAPSRWCKGDLVGYTCMESDVMSEDVEGEFAPGDLLVWGNVGAYGVVFKPPFIDTAPPVFTMDGKGEFRLARRAESLDDLLRTDVS